MITAALLAGGACGLALWAGPPAEEKAKLPFAQLNLRDARVGADLAQFSRLLTRPGEAKPDQELRPKARDASAVYARVAPAVVVVQTQAGAAGSQVGSGTGFLIHPDGWLLTNSHVVAGTGLDAGTGAPMAQVTVGHLDEDGQMQRLPERIPAFVYKNDPARDLALLKLSHKPAGLNQLPVVRLAKGKIPLGADCVAIGHPEGGLLWTVRSGVVAGIGLFPDERSEFVLSALSLKTPAERKSFQRLLATTDKKRVVLSNCGINHGDSGGPLLNKAGELIAVTFATPASLKDHKGLPNLAYHVHRDEVEDFLKDLSDLPAAPPPEVPDPLPVGLFSKLLDLDHDGIPDVLAYSLQQGGRPTGLLFDLNHASPRLTDDDLSNPDKRHLWKFQFAFHLYPPFRTFYDTDNDGKIDLILTDLRGQGKAASVLTLTDGRWTYAKGTGQDLIDPQHFKDRKMQRRFEDLLKRGSSD
jgi:S1-C subfamily serine protease